MSEQMAQEIEGLKSALQQQERWTKHAEQRQRDLEARLKEHEGVAHRNEQLLTELRSLNERLQLATEAAARAEGQASAYLAALKLACGVRE